MHLQLYQFIAYRDGALSASEQQRVERHLAECLECRARRAAFEGIATHLKDYFATHRPEKHPGCSDEAGWRRYLNNEMAVSDQARWKEHLQGCDYCFDLAASLTKERMAETVAAPLQPPEWLRGRADASEVSRQRPSLQKGWTDFIVGLREVWGGLIASPRWAYATAGLGIVLLAGWLVWQQVTSTDAPPLAKLPGTPVQLAETPYQLLMPSAQFQPGDLPGSDEEWQGWYNALTGNEQPKSVVALLTPAFVEALRTLGNSPQDGLERLNAELEAQVIMPPSPPIGAVLVERTLAEGLVQGSYTPNQHLRLTFLTPNETAPTAQTVLKVEAAR